jgi:hypothetical protein
MTVSALSTAKLQDDANRLIGAPTLQERLESARYRRAGLIGPAALYRLAMAIAALEMPRRKGWSIDQRHDAASAALIAVLDEHGRELPGDQLGGRNRRAVLESVAVDALRKRIHADRMRQERRPEDAAPEESSPVDVSEESVTYDGDAAPLKVRHLTPAQAHRAALELHGDLCPTRRREYPVYLAILSSLLVTEKDAGSALELQDAVNDPEARRPYNRASVKRTVADGKREIRESLERDDAAKLLAAADLPQRKHNRSPWERDRSSAAPTTTLAMVGYGPCDLAAAVAADIRRRMAKRPSARV